MAERWISIADLADGAALLSRTLAAGHIYTRLYPCFDGGAALALTIRSLAHSHPEFEEYLTLLGSVSLPSGLMPVFAVFDGAQEERHTLRAVLNRLCPPTEEDELACQEGYYPVGPPEQRFYVQKLFTRGMSPDDDRVGILRKQHYDNVLLPPNFNPPEYARVVSVPVLFFRSLQEHLQAQHSMSIEYRGDKEEDIPHGEKANLYLPLVYLEKLKQLSERHKQQRHGHDTFLLSPTKVQETFKGIIEDYDSVVQELKEEWLTHRVGRPAQGKQRAEACRVARNAAAWLYELWKYSPQGKREVGLNGHEEKKQWVDWRAKEMQDTFDWVLGLLDNEHRKLPLARPHMAAVQQRAQETHWA